MSTCTSGITAKLIMQTLAKEAAMFLRKSLCMGSKIAKQQNKQINLLITEFVKILLTFHVIPANC